MKVTINGIEKDCTQWRCENISQCEDGCIEFEPTIASDPDFIQHELKEKDLGAR